MAKRVLIVNIMDTFSSGGINTLVREILGLDGHDLAFTLLHPGVDGVGQGDIVNFKGGSFYGIGLDFIIKLKDVMKRADFDVIHLQSHLSLQTPLAVFIIKFLHRSKAKIVLNPHYNAMAHETPLGRIFFDLYNCTIGKLYVGMLDTIICSSDYEANAFKRDLSPRCPVVIVPHGVRDVIQSPSRKRLGEKVRLLYVGYILNIKGVHNLLELTRYLVEENIFSEVRLTIIGKVLDENYHAKMEKYAKDHGLSDLIEWRDAVSPDRLPQEYRSHDLFLLLSLGENFGIVAAEALAEGTPCVVSNNTALSEFAMEPGCFKLDVPLDLDQVNALFRELKSSEIVVGPFKKKVLRWDVVMERYLSLY